MKILKTNAYLNFKQDGIAYIFILIFAFSTQFSTHHQETLGWDINTFIVMSQEILRGNLPYENYFDNKGPVLYFLYSIPTYFQNLILIKIFNDLILISVSIQMFYISKKVLNNNNLIFSLLPSLFFLSYMSHPQGHLGMSEVYSLLFLNLSIKQLFKNKKNYFLSGCYLGLAFLVTPSTVLFVLVILLITILRIYSLKSYFLTKQLVLGTLVPFIFIFILYGFKKNLLKVIYALFVFPIEYSSLFLIKNKLIEIYNHLTQYIYLKEFKILGYISLFFLVLFVLTLLSNIFRIKNLGLFNEEQYFKVLILSLILTSLISYIFTPAGHWHYLIYYFGFLSFLPLLIKSTKVINFIFFILIVGFLNISSTTIKTSLDNLSDVSSVNGKYEIFQDYEFLNENYDIETIIALDNHLILFYFNKGGENYILHPSNYQKESYINSLINEGYLEDNEVSILIHEGSADLLICSESFIEICSSNINSYMEINVNNSKKLYFINKRLKK